MDGTRSHSSTPILYKLRNLDTIQDVYTEMWKDNNFDPQRLYLPPGDLGRFSDLTNSDGPTPVDQTRRP